MKYYPNGDIWFYVDKPASWGMYEKYPPHHRWNVDGLPPFTPKVMYYWRDLEGIKKAEITKEDLYIPDMPTERIRPQACLGMLYATGHRFIKLTMAPPSGFKCAPLPVNLATARLVKANLKKLKKQAKRDAIKAKKAAKEEAALKAKNKGKPKGGN